MPASTPRLPIIALATLMVLGLVCSLWLAGHMAERRLLEARAQEAQGQLDLYAQAIHTQVERSRAVPALLALDEPIRDLLQHPNDSSLRQALNRRLEQQNRAAGSTVLYLLDRQGTTLAASNWREPSSFVGNNYGFRPYFQDAISQGSGRYFAVGVTTGVPGYFLSHLVANAAGELLGVLVVKLELEAMQRDWAAQPGILLVADSLDIVILSNRPSWRFRHLRPLDDDILARLVAARRYAEQTLKPLPTQRLTTLGDGSELKRVEGPEGPQRYLWQSLPMPEEGWTLYLLQEPQGAQSQLAPRMAAAAVWLALCFLLLFLAQRRKTHRLEQYSRSELERLVAVRTAELRTTQDELVHAARMAALGQMSAALAHEVNQPLTALRMQLGSLHLLLASGRTDEAHAGLDQAERLIERMAALTSHLKAFARKSPAGLRERLDLLRVLDQALLLLSARIRSEGVVISHDLTPGLLVGGDAIRLEQVLINLLQNALDAMQDCPERHLNINAWREGGHCYLSVADSGAGIANDDLDRVFEPFFTTKPVGQGLGLGLAVSYGIVRDLGGNLEARNRSEGGAAFTLRLPAVELDIARSASQPTPSGA
ncbi:sensor histidine kinase [Stutzerimonas tarimensis]|uniref:histidine kinase n=1 Tax=Stutzerimonas tarimensis TaxID=1507735 RepID=A0ABV7T7C4_9GAMM